jgi:hypothetical protein
MAVEAAKASSLMEELPFEIPGEIRGPPEAAADHVGKLLSEKSNKTRGLSRFGH